jgi:hypothetical protein
MGKTSGEARPAPVCTLRRPLRCPTRVGDDKGELQPYLAIYKGQRYNANLHS